jgi:hypothetical protein
MMLKDLSRQLKTMVTLSSAPSSGLILCLIITASVARASQKCCEEASALDVKIEGLKLENVTMGGALIALVDKHRSGLMIGFEAVPHPPQGESRTISLQIESATVGEILGRLCQADSRYEFKAVTSQLINVYPKGRASDPYSLMDMKIRDFVFRGKAFPPALVETVDKLAPELRQFLDAKRKEWAEKAGLKGGSAGSLLTGNVTAPEVEMDLNDVTVRGILNAIALYGRKLYLEGRLQGLEPAGWKYEFIIDPNAPTGLGGYPRWSLF